MKTDRKSRRTTMVPVTTMEEVPVLTDEERSVLRRSLKEAEASVAAGESIEYERKSFKARLLAIYRGPKR